MEFIVLTVIKISIIGGASLVIAAIGELLTEKTGVLNLGLEGLMLMGAVSAVATVNGILQNPYAGLFAAFLVGGFFSAIFAFASVYIKANQPICGLSMNFIGIGLSGLIGAPFAAKQVMATFKPIKIPILNEIPFIGDIFFNHTILVYVSYIFLPYVVYALLNHTRHGLNIRTVGENPTAADATGINVDRIRFLYTILGGALAGAGGAYMSLAHTPGWSEGMTAGRGWIAIALVIFYGWKPIRIIVGALVFGAVTSLGFFGQIYSWPIHSAFLSMMPYLSTIGLMMVPLFLRSRAELRIRIEPDALGIPFSRGE